MSRTLALLLSVVVLTSPARAVDITSCALPTAGGGPVQSVPARQTAVLQTDLTGCHYAVVLEDHAVLQMNNHKISDCGIFAILCQGRRCTVEGPGEITGGGCNVAARSIDGKLQKMFISDLNVHDTWGSVGGVRTRLYATDVSVAGQLANPSGDTPTSQVAVAGYGVVGKNLIVTDNIGFGISAFSKLRLKDSTVTGNNGFDVGIDLISSARPHLTDTTCGRSTTGDVGLHSWHVCTNDSSPSGAFLDPTETP